MLDTKRKQNAFAILSGIVESPIQEEARKLYDAGLNVFPQPAGKKAGYPWKKLQFVRLHRTHYKFGLHALFVGQCNVAVMCGRTSNDLFVIDCESRAQFEYNIEQMQLRGLPLWAVETTRGGHIYLLSTKGEVESVSPGKIPDTEVRGKGYVIAPPSIHPSGLIYQWKHRDGDTPPAIDPTKVNWLKDYDGHTVRLKSKQNKKRATATKQYNPLSQKTQDYLQNGASLPEGTRNNRLFEAACDMHGNGYTQQDVYAALVPIAKSSGLNAAEITHAIDSAFSKPRTPSKKPKPSSSQSTTQRAQSRNWEAALVYTQNREWTGRTGNTDRAVMLALAERARIGSNENGTFRASVREIAVTARISKETAHKALKRLKTQKVISRAGNDITSKASLWRFGDTVLNDRHKQHGGEQRANWYTRTNGLSSSVPVSASDAVERGALGQSGMRVYRALIANGPLLPKGIAEVEGLSVGQARYGLRKLRDFDLVERLPEGWRAIPATDVQLDERVALPAGTLGKGEARKRRYEEERALFAGREIFGARSRMDPSFFFYRHPNYPNAAVAEFRATIGVNMADLPEESKQSVAESRASQPEEVAAAAALPVWCCPNCGQRHFGEDPPDMCAYCADFTTWRRVDDEVSVPVDRPGDVDSNQLTS